MATELLAEIQRVKGDYLSDLFSRRNVVGVGLGYKAIGGVPTDELSIVVSVTYKEQPDALASGDQVPLTLNGVKTDVVRLGVLRAQDLEPCVLCPSDLRPTATAAARKAIPPGVSMSHYRATAGTFGCLVHRGGEVFILSNNHVLADTNKGQLGDAILQPGPADGGTMDNRIATLAEYVPIDFGTSAPECRVAKLSASCLNLIARTFRSRHQLQAVKQTAGVNRVDAALARPVSSEVVSDDILHIGSPVGLSEAQLGMEVHKTGRTTGYTRGIVTQLDATVRVEYDGASALFSGQIVTSPMSEAGDSGAAVLDMDRHVVGLLFAASEGATIVNPIDEVLSSLNVQLFV
jgi:hypothetical protein